MPYLIQTDYKKLIQDDALKQVLGSDASILTAAEQTAVAQAKSYLVQKFDTSQEFIDTLPWNPATTYKAKARVIIDFPTYSSSNTYALNSVVIYQANGYICSTAITAPEAWNASHWTLLAPQYAIYNAATPYPEFDENAVYSVGDQVFYKGKTYTCKTSTQIIDHGTAIQYSNIESLPFKNVYPDDKNQGYAYWGTGADYSVAAGTLITNTTYWTLGDARDQQMVTYITDLVLFHIHSRIAPRNIPDLRVKRYDDALNWFKMAATGEITPALPLTQPKQGNRIRFGGHIKQTNNY